MCRLLDKSICQMHKVDIHCTYFWLEGCMSWVFFPLRLLHYKHEFIFFRRSIVLAKRWCSHSEWVRMDTAPFSSLTRDTGALLGLGLAQFWKPGGWTLPWVPRTLCLALSSLALHYVSSFQLPTVPPLLFYSLFFLKYTFVPQVVIVLIPGFVHLLTAKPKKD